MEWRRGTIRHGRIVEIPTYPRAKKKKDLKISRILQNNFRIINVESEGKIYRKRM